MSNTSTIEKLLVLVDPLSCGAPALQRALEGVDPADHELAVAVVARPSEFDRSEVALREYLEQLHEQGFTADGWVVPDRRDQLIREIEATGPYARALAISPSGTWRRLVKRDITGLLETAGLEASLHCNP